MSAFLPESLAPSGLPKLLQQHLSLGGTALSSAMSDRLSNIMTPAPSHGIVARPSTVFQPIEGQKELKIFNAAADLKIATSSVSMHLPDDWRRRLFAKIDQLHQPDDWEETDHLTDIRSFWTFLRTVLQQGPMKRMSLGIDGNGNILAGWKRGDDTLTLAFLMDDQIRWSVVQWISGRVESVAGIVDLHRLPVVLGPYSPKRWFGDGDNVPTS
jgi:hypothetical protein